MKKSVTLFFSCFIFIFSHAQWSNTSNQFYDSLHMAVTQAPADQQHSIVVKSYPDSGYFVVWEDYRTVANKADIYAQKYDKNGNALWASGGVAVITEPDNQLLAPSSNSDYRYQSHACTDSAGGFYVVWDDGNETASGSTARHRVGAQHMKQDGSAQFEHGFIAAQPRSGDLFQYSLPQLIADGNKGCYISFYKSGDYGDRDVYVYNYRDENGVMVNHGGGQADLNAEDQVSNTQCGVNTKNDVIYPDAGVLNYFIYPDLQGGCNIVFTAERNAGGNERIRVGFNHLCRVKKESHITVRRRTNDIALSNVYNYTLKKDSVIMLYTVKTFFTTNSCKIIGSDGKEIIIVYTNTYVENFGNGYLNISDPAYNLEFAKGTTATTDGGSDINANIIGVSQRDYNYVSNTVGNWYKRMFVRPEEIYDSIPYQLSTDTVNPYFAYKLFPHAPLDQINYGDDTLLAAGGYDDEFALASSNNRIFAAGRINDQTSSAYPYKVNLQQLQVDRITSDSFAVHYHSPKGGTEIGKEVSTSFTGTNISYDHPFITTDQRGNALFSITDEGGQIRVSPIADSGRLIWGPMGKPIGSGVFNNSYYNVSSPYAIMSPADGTAVIAWTDSRYIAPNSTGLNIYMRHLDSLNYYNYLPPQRGVSLLSYFGTQAFPNVLTGLTHTWNFFEGYYNATGIVSTMAAVYDNYNLGNVLAYALDNPNSDGKNIRYYNGKPYLDRNFTVNVENNPNGSALIDVRLYFTTAQFQALQKADPSIISPGDLVIIKQPKGSAAIPTEYIPVVGEELISPAAWNAVDGGYYVQIQVSSFSYFFIKKNEGVLPVNWLSITAERTTSNTANISWAVANEINVKNYLMQYSEDGIHYKDGCTINANNSGKYNCIISANDNTKYYFRVKETDLDGRSNVSKTVLLDKLLQAVKFVVSPNPVKGDAILKYSMPVSSKAMLRLINSAGALVWQQNTLLAISGTLVVPMSNLSSGAYQLQIKTNTDMQTLKVIKE